MRDVERIARSYLHTAYFEAVGRCCLIAINGYIVDVHAILVRTIIMTEGDVFCSLRQVDVKKLPSRLIFQALARCRGGKFADGPFLYDLEVSSFHPGRRGADGKVLFRIAFVLCASIELYSDGTFHFGRNEIIVRMDPHLRHFVERSRRCTLSAIVSLTYAAGFGVVDEPILSIFIGVDLRPAAR